MIPTRKPPIIGFVQGGSGDFPAICCVYPMLFIMTMATPALITPSSAKAGNSSGETIGFSGTIKAGKLPKCARAIIAPVTDASTIGAKAVSA